MNPEDPPKSRSFPKGDLPQTRRVRTNSGLTLLAGVQGMRNGMTLTGIPNSFPHPTHQHFCWMADFLLHSIPFSPNQPTNQPTSQPAYLPTYQPAYLPTFLPTHPPTHPPSSIFVGPNLRKWLPAPGVGFNASRPLQGSVPRAKKRPGARERKRLTRPEGSLGQSLV